MPSYRIEIPKRLYYAGATNVNVMRNLLLKLSEQAECITFGPEHCADPQNPTPAEVGLMQLIASLKAAGIMAKQVTPDESESR